MNLQTRDHCSHVYLEGLLSSVVERLDSSGNYERGNDQRLILRSGL